MFNTLNIFSICIKNVTSTSAGRIFRNISLSRHLICSLRSVYISSLMMNEEAQKQKSDSFLLLPPACVREMKELDRSLFSKVILVPWIELDESQVSICMKHLKKYLLKLINLKPLQPSGIALTSEEILGDSFEESTSKDIRKRAFLNPSLISSYNDIEEQDRIVLQRVNVSEKCFHFSRLTLAYNNWKADEILQAVLPRDDDCLTSYSIIGHIVHVNISKHLISYKHLIGQVLLDKVNAAKTIVNKVDTIDTTFRHFKMELLCGEDKMTTRTRENGCTFELDFSSVYWNPRLGTEHERITQKLKSGDVLYDVFAGIGPFSIPAAKKKCHVLANDLNPESCKWLKQNGKLNKVEAFLKSFNKDGKLFLQEDVKKDMLERWKGKEFRGKSMHITMNLPALAVTFLNVFNGMFKSEELKSTKISCYPIVHVYCFTKADEHGTAKRMVEENLGVELQKNLIELTQVRNVAPTKDMVRVSFKLSPDVLGASEDAECEGPPQKRACLVNAHSNGETEEQKQQEQQCV